MMIKKTVSLLMLAVILTLSLASCGQEQEVMIYNAMQLNSGEYTIVTDYTSKGAMVCEDLFPNAVHNTVTTSDLCYTAVLQGKADACVYDTMLIERAIHSGNIKGIALLEETFDSIDLAIGLPKGKAALRDELSAFIIGAKSSGVMDDIYYRWITLASDEMPEIAAPISPTRHFTVGTCGTLEPFSYISSGELVGIDIEIIKRLEVYLNAKIDIVTMDFPALVAALDGERVDFVVSDFNITEERQKVIDYTVPYMTSAVGVCVKASRYSRPKALNTVSDLDGKKIGILRGSGFDGVANECISDAETVYYSDVSDMIAALKSGQIDAYLTDEPSAKLQVKECQGITIMNQCLTEEDYAFTFCKTNIKLYDKFDEGLKHLIADGTCDRLQAKWLFGSEEHIEPEIIGDYEAENGTLKVITAADDNGFCFYQDGEIVGYLVDLVRLIAKAMDMRVEIETVSSSALLQNIESGNADVGLSLITVTEELKKSVLFSEPFYSGSTVAVVRSTGNSSVVISSLSDVKNIRIGILVGSVFDADVEDKFSDCQKVYYNSYSECILALKHGTIQAYAADRPIATIQTVKTDGISAMTEQIASHVCGFAVAKNNSALTAQLNAALAELKSDGTYKTLEDKWINNPSDTDEIDAVDLPDNAPVLRVACCSEINGYCHVQNGKIAGYDAELIVKAAAKLGMKVEFADMTFGALIYAIERHNCDVAIGAICITDERKESVDFTAETFDLAVVLVVKDNTEKDSAGFFDSMVSSFERTFITENRWQLVLKGLLITFILSIFSTLFGTVLGFLFSFPLRSTNKVIKAISKGFSSLVSGTPLVVILMVLYYIVFAKTSLPAVIIGVLGISLTFAIQVAGMLNTGIGAVSKGQFEAAEALGYREWQAFFKIIFPQATNIMFNQYKGAVVELVKATAVVGYITIEDLTRAGDIIRGRTYEAFFPLISTAIIYFLLSSLLIKLLGMLGNRLEPQNRKNILSGIKIK